MSRLRALCPELPPGSNLSLLGTGANRPDQVQFLWSVLGHLSSGSRYREDCHVTSGSDRGNPKDAQAIREYFGKNREAKLSQSEELAKTRLEISHVRTHKEMSAFPRVSLYDPEIASTKGSYVLIVGLHAEKRIHVGNLGVIPFPPGCYAYLGSALGGFKSRLNRHLTKDKKQKWHIDYLLSEAQVLQVILCEVERRLECLLSQVLANEFSSVPGFGSSDCRCKSHLYFADNRACLERGIRRAIADMALPRQACKETPGF